jgi:hypothetical protein
MPTPPKPKPRPVGRPKLHDQAKSSIVPIRFSAEDRSNLEFLAAREGVSVSEFVRKTILAVIYPAKQDVFQKGVN